MTDLRTRILQAWHGTPLVSKFMASDEARAQRVVEMLESDDSEAYVERAQGRAALRALEDLEAGRTDGMSLKRSWLMRSRNGLYQATLAPHGPMAEGFCMDAIRKKHEASMEKIKSLARQDPLEPVEQGDAGSICQDRESRRDAASAGTDAMSNVPASPALPRYTTTVTVDDELGGNVSVRFRVDPEGAWVNAGAALARIAELERSVHRLRGMLDQATLDTQGDAKHRAELMERISALEAENERLRTETAEARREAMVWEHRFNKETEVLPEREKLSEENERLRDAIRELTRIGGSVLSSLKLHAGVTDYHSASLIGRYVKASDAALDLFEPRAPAGETKTAESVIQAGGNPVKDEAPRKGPTDSASPAPAWTEDQRERAEEIADYGADLQRTALECVERCLKANLGKGAYRREADYIEDSDRLCAEIAKHASLFVKPRVVTREEFEKAVKVHRENTPISNPANAMRAALRALGLEVA